MYQHKIYILYKSLNTASTVSSPVHYQHFKPSGKSLQDYILNIHELIITAFYIQTNIPTKLFNLVTKCINEEITTAFYIQINI